MIHVNNCFVGEFCSSLAKIFLSYSDRTELFETFNDSSIVIRGSGSLFTYFFPFLRVNFSRENNLRSRMFVRCRVFFSRGSRMFVRCGVFF